MQKSNFSLWKRKIKAILRKENCLEEIEDMTRDISNEWN